MSGAVESLDRTVMIVSVALFAGLAVSTIAAVLVSGVSGLGVMFVVWLIAVPVWSRVVRDWMTERQKLLEGTARAVEGELLEELRRLRESIEALRRSLEG